MIKCIQIWLHFDIPVAIPDHKYVPVGQFVIRVIEHVSNTHQNERKQVYLIKIVHTFSPIFFLFQTDLSYAQLQVNMSIRST